MYVLDRLFSANITANVSVILLHSRLNCNSSTGPWLDANFVFMNGEVTMTNLKPAIRAKVAVVFVHQLKFDRSQVYSAQWHLN